MEQRNYTLGTVEASEQLINDLYIELRKKVNKWASITHQTAQARMGYVGQHLVSVVTGCQGGRSGARGKDLVLPNDEHAEIKTCYRVDQLGKCNNCKAAVSAIEDRCHRCGSENLERKDDSKWLISIRHEEEFAEILTPQYYYLVLFEFTDLASPDTIRSSIWRVDPTVPGFAYCMIDYYKNIRERNVIKKPNKTPAPFDFWPCARKRALKFDLMRPILIYRSYIRENSVRTEIFPGRDPEQPHTLHPLTEYSRSTNLTKNKINSFAESIGASSESGGKKPEMLEQIQRFLDGSDLTPEVITDSLSKALYWSDIEQHIDGLPESLKARAGL